MTPYWSDGAAAVWHGDALNLPLPDASVDLIVTSPPYFGLRSYQDDGEHYAGQIGSEATHAEFVDALIAATREMVRVLKPSGSLWINLGDKYSAHPSGDRARDARDGTGQGTYQAGMGQNVYGIRPKSLLGIPWRYALRCIDDLGLILRAEVIWCLSGGARVYARMPGGDRPIMLRDLVRAYRPDQVQLWNGTRWTHVLGWNRTPDDDGALELELRTGERIGCTPGHKWPTSRGMLRADEIRVGDVVATTRLPEPDAPRDPAFLPDDDIGWLVGLYIAEGSRSERTVQFSGHVRETARHARLARISAALDGTSRVYQTSEAGATCNLTGSAILGVIDRYVSPGTAKTKRLRLSAWQRSDTFLRAVLDGYLSGDGHYDAKNDRWRLGFTANDEWAADLRTIAARLGLVLKLRRAVHRMAGRTFPGWRGELRYTRSTHHNAKQDGEVVAVRNSRARDFYDLGVEDEPHLFALASGVLTSNSKPNGLPESVTDRVRRSHEQWFHFTLEPRYYSAVDEVREVPTYTGPAYTYAERLAVGEEPRPTRGLASGTNRVPNGRTQFAASALGKLPGSVWTIPTQPLRVPDHLGVDHFAAFPMEWPRRIIRGWSPRDVCTACGEGRRPVTTQAALSSQGSTLRTTRGSAQLRGMDRDDTRHQRDVLTTITGYACACTPYTDHAGTGGDGGMPRGDVGNVVPGGRYAGSDRLAGLGGRERVGPWREYHWQDWTPAPTTPGIVLDPFGGTGTTALVAVAEGRTAHHVDLSADYCRLARWRITDPGERARAREVDKPPVEIDGQDDLLTLLDDGSVA